MAVTTMARRPTSAAPRRRLDVIVTGEDCADTPADGAAEGRPGSSRPDAARLGVVPARRPVTGGRHRSGAGPPGFGPVAPVESPAAPSRPGRLVRRWVPAAIGSARLDPGRSGALAVGLVAVIAVAVVLVGLLWRPTSSEERLPALPLASVDDATDGGASPQAAAISTSATPEPAELVVSVVGRVGVPGLVTLTAPARVADAIEAAGGAHPDADLDTVNLARSLADGEQIHVDAPLPPGAGADGGVIGGAVSGGAAQVSAGAAPLDLNTASAAQLDTLPGVGPVTAQAIIDWRAAHGGFSSVEDLRDVDGIGPTRYERLKDLVRS
ncbi:competence protein ComEA [Actinoalloteichus hoggarensis]|uniref:ComE operon protein 1 n=1 Tax=Actinoalloteichus hoggarensis TaxID=1470176 RepID=A0A221W0A0_9PSEU|nr:ComEA family DNA-binding protein [Actinoalloteichus hoggarensis]ASO19197.1 ComE operon protein 1 [Actinoalloteichus hoggarensis]MBB5920434.1 competence protein ComEA [Actinoalloteichus hoggarensis]